MNVAVRRLGSAGREMVGVLTSADGARSRSSAVLLCRPFGPEAVRTSPMYRVLASRLARQGISSLVIDYHGTGDSPGEEDQQSLAGWTTDIEAAAELLRSECPGVIDWFAMGLSAHMALRAAARAVQPPRRLFLWEPVVNGPDYAEALFDAHRQEIAFEYNYPWSKLVRSGRVEEPRLPGSVLGVDIGDALASEIARIDGLPLAPSMRRGVRVTCCAAPELLARIALEPGASLAELVPVESRMNWMLSQAHGGSLVPPELLPAVLRALD